MNWGIRMTKKSDMDSMLDDLFAEARDDQNAQVSDKFLARILEDAETLQPSPEQVRTDQKSGFWTSLFETIGGWQGTGGLVAATMASVFIGFSGAEALTIDSLTTVITGDTTSYLADLSGGFEILSEGE